MTKLTRRQRHMLYMIMLAEWETELYKSNLGSLHGFCRFLSENTYYETQNVKIELKSLPELMKRKPHTNGMFWFGISTREEQLKRISILKEAINETYDPF